MEIKNNHTLYTALMEVEEQKKVTPLPPQRGGKQDFATHGFVVLPLLPPGRSPPSDFFVLPRAPRRRHEFFVLPPFDDFLFFIPHYRK